MGLFRRERPRVQQVQDTLEPEVVQNPVSRHWPGKFGDFKELLVARPELKALRPNFEQAQRLGVRYGRQGFQVIDWTQSLSSFLQLRTPDEYPGRPYWYYLVKRSGKIVVDGCGLADFQKQMRKSRGKNVIILRTFDSHGVTVFRGIYG